MTPPEIDIAVQFESWTSPDELLPMVERVIAAAQKIAELSWQEGAELSLVFTSDAEVQKINAEWREIDKPTNVLSFPGDDIEVGQTASLMIGDIVLAYETIEREALKQSKPFHDHLMHLLAHGFLHLFGYDHLDDGEAELMEATEIKILAEMGIANPYM